MLHQTKTGRRASSAINASRLAFLHPVSHRELINVA